MAYVKKHISLDQATDGLLDDLARRYRRTHSELVREALWRYARDEADQGRRQAAKAAVHAAIDRAAGAWSPEQHLETLTPETYRKWREELWAADQEELSHNAP